MKTLFQMKTFWTGFAAVLAGVGGMVTGDMNHVQGVQTILGGLAVIFMRQAVENNK